MKNVVALLPRVLKNENGVTLTELMITTFLMSIVGLVLVEVLMSGLTIMTGIESRTKIEGEAQQISGDLVWKLRTGQQVNLEPVLALADQNAITYYSVTTVGGTPVRNHYFLDPYDNTILKKGIITGQEDSNGIWVFLGTETVSYAGQYVRNNTSTPLFRYYDENGVELQPATSDDRKKVRKIKISVICDDNITKDPPAYTSTREVRLRNQK